MLVINPSILADGTWTKLKPTTCLIHSPKMVSVILGSSLITLSWATVSAGLDTAVSLTNHDCACFGSKRCHQSKMARWLQFVWWKEVEQRCPSFICRWLQTCASMKKIIIIRNFFLHSIAPQWRTRQNSNLHRGLLLFPKFDTGGRSWFATKSHCWSDDCVYLIREWS